MEPNTTLKTTTIIAMTAIAFAIMAICFGVPFVLTI